MGTPPPPPAPRKSAPSGKDPAPEGPIARLLRLAAEDPGRPALRQASDEDGGPETVLTRADLAAEIARMAGALRAAGTRPGDAVALMAPNSKELVLAHYALWALGATAVVLSPYYTPLEVGRCLRDARPAGIVTAAANLAALRSVKEDLGPNLRFQKQIEPGSATDSLYAGAPSEPELKEPAPNHLATIHFTYKGLGYPLGAMHEYQHYSRAAEALGRFYRADESHTFLCALPLSHIYAITCCIVTPLYFGGATAIVKNAKPHSILAYAKSHAANVVCLVPALYRLLGMCVRRSGREALDGLYWISGGSYLSPELYDELERDLGVRPWQGYGLTEALIVTASNWESNRPGTLGVPIFKDTEIVAVNEDGETLPPGEVGEIAVRAPTVMTGYVNRPQETSRFLRDGRVLTGDVGCVDGDGFLHFAGRRRRFAKIAGFMVDLKEIEGVIRLHPAIETCAVSAEPDEVADEYLRAAVTLRPGAELALAQLVEHCAARMAFYKVPKGFRFIHGGRARSGERVFPPMPRS